MAISVGIVLVLLGRLVSHMVVECPRNIDRFQIGIIAFLGLLSRIVDIIGVVV